MLQMVFHTYAGPLQLLMCASWLSAKLKPKISMGFLCVFGVISTLWDLHWMVGAPWILKVGQGG
jgi:hypothetical protein